MPEYSVSSALVRLQRGNDTTREPVGAGFLVSNRHIVTCAHVVSNVLGVSPHQVERPEDLIFADFPLIESQPTVRAKVVSWHPGREPSVFGALEDIAVLELAPETPLPQGAEPAPVVVIPENGFFDRSVRMCGFPEGMDNGDWVTGKLQGMTGAGWVQFDHDLNQRGVAPGFSGAAVWDKEKNAVSGMMVSVITREGKTSAYMIPAAALKKAFPALDTREHGEPGKEPLPRPLTQKETNIRNRYLMDIRLHVENFWKESIHHARFLDLGIADTPIATHLPWIYKNPESKREFTHIDEAFHTYKKRMLLLGAPGAGKTTTLLNIARGMIAEAQRDPSAPIPLIVNLSKFQFQTARPALFSRWRPTPENPEAPDRSFEAWMVSEFTALPGVSRPTAQKWVEEGRVAALLDGLDEVNDEFRARLSRLLNTTYLRDHPDSVVLVCSRIDEYRPLQERKETRLQLAGSVTLQPLSRESIEDYLDAYRAEGIRDALDKDASLYELAETPLTLSMMTLAYAGMAASQIPTFSSIADQHHHLMESYVARMLQRKERRDRDIPFDEDEDKDVPLEEYRHHPDRINRCLSWLALHLSVRMQTSCSLGKFYGFMRRESGGRKDPLDAWAIRFSHVVLLVLMMGIVCMPILPLDARSILTALGIIVSLGGVFMIFTAFRDRWEEKGWFLALQFIAMIGLTSLGFGVTSRALFVIVPFSSVPVPIGFIALTSCIAITFSIILLLHKNVKTLPVPASTLVGVLIGTSFIYFFEMCEWPADWIIAVAMTVMQMVGIVMFFLWEENRSTALIMFPFVLGMLSMLVACLAAGVWLVGSLHWILVFILIGTTLIMISDVSEESAAPLAVFVFFSAGGGFFYKVEGSVLGTMAILFSYIMWSIVNDSTAKTRTGIIAAITSFAKRYIEEIEERKERWILSPASLFFLVLSRCVPLCRRDFFNYCGQALILKPFSGEIEFVHRRLRDYFALRNLIPELKGSGAHSNLDAIQAFGFQGISAIYTLTESLRSGNVEERAMAVRSLGKISAPDVVEHLESALMDSDPEVRQSVVSSLGNIPGDDRGRLLKIAANDSVHEVQLAVIDAMYDSDPLSKEPFAVRLFIEKLDQERFKPELLKKIVAKIEFDHSSAFAMKLPPSTKEPLKKLLLSNDVYLRMNTCLIMGHNKEIAAIEMIINLLVKDRDFFVRQKAANVLGLFGDKRAVEPLIKALMDNEGSVRSRAARALGNLGDKRAVEPLIKALMDNEESVRRRAADALGDLGDKRAVEPLIKALTDENRGVRSFAAGALGNLKDKRAVEPLIKALSDEDGMVKLFVSHALDILGDKEAMKPSSKELRDK